MNIFIWKRIISTPYGTALGLCILLQGVLMATAAPLLPVVISNDIGLDKLGVTTFFLVNTLVGIVVTLGTGYLSDGAVARYKLVGGGGLIAALGYLGIALAVQPIHAFIACPCLVGLGVMFPQLFAVAKAGVVADWEQQQQVIGITALRTLFSFGYIIGTAFSSVLARSMDIQAAFFLIGGGVVLLTLYAGWILHQVEGYIAQRSTRTDATAAHLPVDARAVILPIAVLFVPLMAITLLQGADSTRLAYLSLVMFQMFGDASIAPLMFGIGAAVELITMGVLGYLSSKIRENVVIAIGALFGAVQFLMLSFAPSLPVLYFSSVIHAVFVAALFGVAMAYVQRMLSHRVGMGGSLYVVVLNIGSLVGILSPLLVTGYDQKIFIIPAILCVIGALMLLFGDRTTQTERRLQAQEAA